MTNKQTKHIDRKVWSLIALQIALMAGIFLAGLYLGVHLADGQSSEMGQFVVYGLIALAVAFIMAVISTFPLRLFKQLHAAKELIDTLADTDELTGLPNRHFFFKRFEEEIDRARRYGSSLSLIMLDVDHFKQVNDEYGHPVGDDVLGEVARLLAANVRTSDIIARYRDEEFAILIPAMGAAEAAQAAEKLRTVIEVNDMVMDGPEIHVTISAGVADIEILRNKGGSLKDALIRNANRALYHAKSEGRNRVEVHTTVSATQLPLI